MFKEFKVSVQDSVSVHIRFSELNSNTWRVSKAELREFDDIKRSVKDLNSEYEISFYIIIYYGSEEVFQYLFTSIENTYKVNVYKPYTFGNNSGNSV